MEFPIFYDVADESGGGGEAPPAVTEPVAEVIPEDTGNLESDVVEPKADEKPAETAPVPDEPAVLSAEAKYRLTDGTIVSGAEVIARQEYLKKTDALATERQEFKKEQEQYKGIVDFAQPLIDRLNHNPADAVHALIKDLQAKGLLAGYNLADPEGYVYEPKVEEGAVPYEIQQKLTKQEQENQLLRERVARNDLDREWSTGVAEIIRKPENKGLYGSDIQAQARSIWDSAPALTVQQAMLLAKMESPSPSPTQVAPKQEPQIPHSGAKTTPPAEVSDGSQDPYEAIYLKHANR